MIHMRPAIALVSVILVVGCQAGQTTTVSQTGSDANVSPEKAVVCNDHNAYSLKYPHECLASGGVIMK